MRQKPEIRTRWLHIRMSEKEYESLVNLYNRSTCRAMSEYVRNVILNEPVIIKSRNFSIDDFLAEMIGLKKELKIGNDHLNEALIRLRTLNSITELQQWIFRHEADKNRVVDLIQSISSRINKLYKVWLQE